MWGNYMAFKEELQNLDLIMTLIKNVYLKKSKLKGKELDEILKHDLFFNSSKCLKMGLVDQII
jgi:ATP-dependent protease ClpP protease subunit